MRCLSFGYIKLSWMDSCQIQNIFDLGIHLEKSALAECFMWYRTSLQPFCSFSSRRSCSLPPCKPSTSESVICLLTCFGAEPCGSLLWQRVVSASFQSSHRSEQLQGRVWGLLSDARCGRIWPQLSRRLNCRMASALIRNAGKRWVPFGKRPPPPQLFSWCYRKRHS